jgi:hypothetical protein
MKNKKLQFKIGVIAIMAGLYSTGAVAETQNGTAVATVITPLVINNLVTMDFTTISAGSAGGVLSMDATGAVTVASGDADVIGGGAGTALAFDISGETGQAYTLSVGNGVLSDGSGNTMAITTDAVAAPGLTVAAQTVTVSGDLTVGASQTAGSYSTANGGGTPITITANYN